MLQYINPARSEWASLIERNIPDDEHITRSVADIIAAVRQEGDAALRRFALEFDHTEISQLEVSEEEMAKAAELVSPQVKEAIAVAKDHISRFHREQMPRTVDIETESGVRCCQRAVPIQRVGLYVPGGRAPLFSTVLMLALPARIAGCPEIVLCTPQGAGGHIAPEILYAAQVCGVHHVFRIGGAQAVAAMAYGTESIPRVDKIFGPGNRFVTYAKQQVSRVCAIDMPAGPSEVLVMADATANPAFVAADMLSQAEHGPDSQAMLVCNDEAFAKKVEAEVKEQTARLSRADLVEQSLSHSRILVFPSREEMCEFSNAYAPEHLIIQTERPWELAVKV
ncbi:MAG: histidinol dehydrogenase, partial [Alloprevotella sp.]|nr:histidinol dehydrogenase [Alloprevotella sp.]